MSIQQIKLLLWNVEWRKPNTPAGKYIQHYVNSISPEIICYTEVCDGLFPEQGYLIESDCDYGYKNRQGRKVSIWSSEPWSEVDSTGSKELPSGRFVTGINMGIRFIGVCIPWRDAHVRTGRKDRTAWQDHSDYLTALHKLVVDYQKDNTPICIMGDYNQRIPRTNQPEIVFTQLNLLLDGNFKTATAEILDPDEKQLIDHISTTAHLEVHVNHIHPKVTAEGLTLSDHVGVIGTLIEKRI